MYSLVYIQLQNIRQAGGLNLDKISLRSPSALSKEISVFSPWPNLWTGVSWIHARGTHPPTGDLLRPVLVFRVPALIKNELIDAALQMQGRQWAWWDETRRERSEQINPSCRLAACHRLINHVCLNLSSPLSLSLELDLPLVVASTPPPPAHALL
jgi:hypothetical protein